MGKIYCAKPISILVWTGPAKQCHGGSYMASMSSLLPHHCMRHMDDVVSTLPPQILPGLNMSVMTKKNGSQIFKTKIQERSCLFVLDGQLLSF